jgi:hypothetical protein
MKKKNTSVASQSSASGSPQGGSIRLTDGYFNRSLHRQRRSLSMQQVLDAIRRRVIRQWGLTEVVGQWVWVHRTDTLDSMERSHLFELGFHWSPRRQAWQHPCGQFQSPPSRQQFIRYFPAELESGPLQFIPHC